MPHIDMGEERENQWDAYYTADKITRDDAMRWFKGFMARVDGPFKAFLAAVEDDYHKRLGEDAPALELRAAAIAETAEEMIGDDVEWGRFDD